MSDQWPDGFYFIGELRRAVGLFDGAMSKSPKEAWEEAIAEVRVLRSGGWTQQRRNDYADGYDFGRSESLDV